MRTRAATMVIALVLVAGVVGGCKTVKPGARCRTTELAQSGDYVMACRNGRWTRFLTKAQATSAMVALLQARTTTTTTAAPTTTTAAPSQPIFAPATTVPPPLPAPKAVDLAVTRDHSCAALDDGTVRCWGSNNTGQLGNGEGPFDLGNAPPQSRDLPVTVLGITDAVDVGVGLGFSCALRSGGTVSCWGDNSVGQLGTDTRPPAVPGGPLDTAADSNVPLAIAGLSGVRQLEVGPNQVCAVRTAGQLVCWGRDGGGTTIDANPAFTPVAVSSIGAVSSVAVADDHTCALRPDQRVACWGRNTFGQLGGGTGDPVAPTGAIVASATSVSALQVTYGATCVVAAGTPSCWGSPTTVATGVSARAAISLAAHGCGVEADRVQCWTVVDLNAVPWTLSAVPVDQGLSGIAAISGDREQTCAMSASGAVWCFGHNDLGQLGNGTALSSGGSLTPVRVHGMG